MPARTYIPRILPQLLAVAAAVLLMITLLPLAGGAQQAQGEEFCADPAPAPFEDRDRIADVHLRNVDCAYEHEITQGRQESDGKLYFHPVDDISRGQFAAFVFRTLDVLGKADDLPPPKTPPFDDVPPTHEFYEEIHRLAAAEIVLGYGDGRYGPGDPVRRDQTASFLVRAAEWVLDKDLEAEGGPYFSDTEGNVHRENISIGYEQGFVLGKKAPEDGEQGLYVPSEHTTRQQMASVVLRFIRELNDGTQSPSPSPSSSPGGPLDEVCEHAPQLPVCEPSPGESASPTPSGSPTPSPTPSPTSSSFCDRLPADVLPPELCEQGSS